MEEKINKEKFVIASGHYFRAIRWNTIYNTSYSFEHEIRNVWSRMRITRIKFSSIKKIW